MTIDIRQEVVVAITALDILARKPTKVFLMSAMEVSNHPMTRLGWPDPAMPSVYTLADNMPREKIFTVCNLGNKMVVFASRMHFHKVLSDALVIPFMSIDCRATEVHLAEEVYSALTEVLEGSSLSMYIIRHNCFICIGG